MVNDDHYHKNQTCQFCGLASVCLANLAISQVGSLYKEPLFLEMGEIVAEEGSPLKRLYIVRAGSLKHTHLSQDGHEQVTDFYLPGDIIGLDCLSSSKHCCNLISLEQSVICAIKLEDLHVAALAEPLIQQKLMHSLSQKLMSRTRALLLQHQHAEQKLAAFLLDISKRFKRIGRNNLGYNLSMSRQEIGNYLHLSTETVSRIFSKFQLERIIDVHKKQVVLKDIDRLYAKLMH
jgi:CRP/FNR family transcriptional regulator